MKNFWKIFLPVLCSLFCMFPAWANEDVVASVEYFYALDGTLIGKAVNGVRVNYEYDKRGQMLAVKDIHGRDLERYTYDPAGNRLSKTINGKTTTYTYDNANQLVTSTENGKTTHYKYDAAGRMIQVGDKVFRYGDMNKVVEISRKGRVIAQFEYFMDGQLASARYGDKVEKFLWDGLALIQRNGKDYINEPYVTGGNPVMAGDDVLFNDMLGSTLAVNGKPVEMTAFGETTDADAFFTGKPMISELGYSFLFRDYDPGQGKWTTTDPLGYPDGWNNLAYCNNETCISIDTNGLYVTCTFSISKQTLTITEQGTNETVTVKAKSGDGDLSKQWTTDGSGPLPLGCWEIVNHPSPNRWQLWYNDDSNFDDYARKGDAYRYAIRLVVNDVSHGCISIFPTDPKVDDAINLLSNTSYVFKESDGQNFRCFGVITVKE